MGRMKELVGDQPYTGKGHQRAGEWPNDDPFEGLERKRRGLGRIEERHGGWIDTARKVLLHSGLDVVTSDDLHRLLQVPPPHPNAVGAVFHCPLFTWTGRRIRSRRAEAHGRDIKEWKVKR